MPQGQENRYGYQGHTTTTVDGRPRYGYLGTDNNKRTEHRQQGRPYDIVNDYDWTTIPRGSALREEAPCAYVTAYELEFSQLQAFVDGYISLAATAVSKSTSKDPGLEFYKNIYKSTKQLGNFNFPFFSEDIRSFSTEFADTFSPISQRGAKFLGADIAETLGGVGEEAIGGTIALGKSLANMGGNAIADKVASIAKDAEGYVAGGFEKLTGKKMPGLQTVGAPGSYIETPKFYQYSNTDNPLEISFALANTIENDGEARNSEFIKYFTTINRPRRLGAIAMTYPAIYHIEVPGQRYIEWAYLENFNVGLLGTRRRIGRKVIPEAYSCNFSFRSLTIEAANFMDKIYDTEAFDEGDANYIELRLAADEERAKVAEQARNDLAVALGVRPGPVEENTSPHLVNYQPEVARKLGLQSKNRYIMSGKGTADDWYILHKNQYPKEAAAALARRDLEASTLTNRQQIEQYGRLLPNEDFPAGNPAGPGEAVGGGNADVQQFIQQRDAAEKAAAAKNMSAEDAVQQYIQENPGVAVPGDKEDQSFNPPDPQGDAVRQDDGPGWEATIEDLKAASKAKREEEKD